MTERYRAFLSYSHADEAWAARLQRSLERYRVPGRLRKEEPGLPRRLYPIFRDREELASGTDLGEAIRDALARSDALVVICSPSAAASRWVNEEILAFRALAPGRSVLCLLVDGDPDPAAEDCAFPPALLKSADGSALPEPLAADARSVADGRRGAFLKITAGLLGVGIDALRQRDQQRKLRVLVGIAIGAVAVAVVTIGLAINAQRARTEAELRRGQAENLIEFMLVDLRARLEAIGKLEILDSVGDEAMAYFGALGDLGTADEMLARAMTLRQIGEVRFGQGRLDSALESFTESRKVTVGLQASSPDDNEFLFELGQSEFWVGYVAWERNDLVGASAAFSRYREIGQQLLAREPGNSDYLRELSYAASNLGSVSRERGAPAEALTYFSESVRIDRELLAAAPDDASIKYDLAEGLSWLGSVNLDLRRLEDSEQRFREANTLLGELHDAGGRARHSEALGDAAMLLAEVQANRGKVDDALASVDRAVTVFRGLVNFDSENARWRTGLYRALRIQAQLLYSTGRMGAARVRLIEAERGFSGLVEQDGSNMDLLQRLSRVEAMLAWLDQIQGGEQDPLAGAASARRKSDEALDVSSKTRKQLKQASEVRTLQGDVLFAAGRQDDARQAWLDAEKLLTPENREDPVMQALYLRVSARLGWIDEATRAAASLAEIGFRDPRYEPQAAP